jgi:hypothetical protein
LAVWTKNAQEYEHAQKIVVLSIDLVGRKTKVHLMDGNTLHGTVVGGGSGTNLGENMAAGRGAAATAMWGEVRLVLEDNTKRVLDARVIEIEKFS